MKMELLELIVLHNRDKWRQVSLVCKQWLLAECMTRSSMKVLSYAAEPRMLSRRCPNVKVLKIKGERKLKCGCKATPWIQEITNLGALTSLEFSGMDVSDNDLHILATSKLRKLEVLELYECYGFSTDGLFSIAKYCKNLEKLVLDTSIVLVKDGEWLHQISVHNHSLKVLNFYLTPNIQVNTQDLEALAKNCPLTSLKIGLVDILELNGFFTAAHKLQQFFGGSFSTDGNRSQDMYRFIKLPSTLCGLGNFYMKACDMALLSPFADRIQYLDLRFALLGINDQCHLLQTTPNLEVLELFSDIQDQVLTVIAKSCKKLKQLRILLGPDMKTSRRLTHKGLISVSQGCQELECIEVYILTINNEALQVMGKNLKNLREFRLTLTSYKKEDKALPLDEGVRALLMGCTKMRKFKLYLREGDLTDVGLKYIGQYGKNVTELVLGECGGSDEGLIALSRGCPKLQKLEMRWCNFSEYGIATAVMNLPSLRFLRAISYKETKQGDLSIMTRPYWKIELTSSGTNQVPDKPDESVESELLAYYSLVDQ